MNNFKEILHHIEEQQNRIKNEEQELKSQMEQLRAETLNNVKDAIVAFGFTAEEIGIKVAAVKQKEKKTAVKEKKEVPVKYRTPEGITWTGRGKMPTPMRLWLEANHKTRDDIAV